MSMMRKLLEAMSKFAGEPEQKPGEQWKGTDKGTPGKKLVGDSIIKDLAKGPTPKTKEEELAEAYANFMEDDIGVEEKRPSRKGSRPGREYTKHGKPSKRYTTVEEGWNTGSDRVSLPDEPRTYWNGTGALQKEYEALYEKLVPAQGAAETIEGEVLRAASKIVYRHFNDGDEFNQASYRQLEQYIGPVTSYDDLAHKATEFALKANGNYHPNQGWDSLDVMDYGPAEEDDDYDDEEDDDSWDHDDDEDLLGEGMEEFAKSQAKQRAAKRKSIPWPKEVPTDAEQERDRTRDEEENDPHPYADTPDLDEGAADDDKEVDEGRGPSKGLHKKVTIVKGRDAGKTGYVRQIKTDKLRNRVYLDLDLEDGGQAVVLKQDVRLVKEVDEARTTWNNDFYVYDPKTKTVKKKFRTHKGAKQYAEANGLKVASAEYYHDSVSKEVDEGMEEFAKAQAKKRADARKEKSQPKEGWGGSPGAPDDRPRVERDPDAEYDAMRTAKADDEMMAQQAKRPQTKVYSLSGRGPNQEPNYEFPGEYATQDEADKARARLMADPKTPNPRDIGIRSRTKYLDENSVTPLRDLEDYQAKKKALQDIQTDPDTSKDPELSLAVMRRLAGLEKQRSELK
jgi:hypothetical protein